MKRTKGIILLILIIFSQKTFSQTGGCEISIDDLNKQILLLVENKKIYNNLVQEGLNGEPSIFINCSEYPGERLIEPIQNAGFNTYFWFTEDLFFYDIDYPHLEITNCGHNYVWTEYELIIRSKKNSFFINVKFLHYDLEKKMEITTEIDKIEISKIKTIN